MDILRYMPGPRKFADLVAKEVKGAMEDHEGDVLVFVPGEREIMCAMDLLESIDMMIF